MGKSTSFIQIVFTTVKTEKRLTGGWKRGSFQIIRCITVHKLAISQSEALSTVLISYDIKSLTRYRTISWSLSSKVMLLYDKLKGVLPIKQKPSN